MPFQEKIVTFAKTLRTSLITLMEALLHYVWQHRLFPQTSLSTTQGEVVEVLDVGLHNTDAGPDFFNAKIRIGTQLWVGNVEIHLRSSDWFRHQHETDARYDNVILHVVCEADREVSTKSGRTLPQLVIEVPQHVADNYHELMEEDNYPPCHQLLASLPIFEVHAWLSALTFERLQQKTERIDRWLTETSGDWERVAFIVLARAFGFGKNTDAFERWAVTLDPQHTGKHRDDAQLIEAFFFGQAGLLDTERTPPSEQDSHFQTLVRDYRFLQQKFSLTPISPLEWKFLRLRPQNFPHVRLAQLAALYGSQRFSLARIRQSTSVEDVRNILSFNTLPYWIDRYKFGDNSAKTTKKKDKYQNRLECSQEQNREINTVSCEKEVDSKKKALKVTPCLSTGSQDLLLINAVIPLLFAFGRHHQDSTLMDKAITWLEQLRAERNHVVQMWQAVGITAEHAADSQALLQLKWQYCDRHDCLRCRFGTRYLQQRKSLF